MRQEISLNPDDFQKVLTDKGIVKEFGRKTMGRPNSKTAPKGFEKDDPMLDYLRKKQFLLKTRLHSKKKLPPKDFDKKSSTRTFGYAPLFRLYDRSPHHES